MKIGITSGYFNPLSPGHIECFRLLKEMTDYLIVIVNNDAQALLKRGVKSFQPEIDRLNIVSAIKYVDMAVLAKDDDGSVCKTLEHLILSYQDRGEVIWGKGGDQFKNTCPEFAICEKYGVAFVDGLGAKTHNSSDYLKDYFHTTQSNVIAGGT